MQLLSSEFIDRNVFGEFCFSYILVLTIWYLPFVVFVASNGLFGLNFSYSIYVVVEFGFFF